MSIKGWMDKQNTLPCNGILFSQKNPKVLIHATTWIKLESIMLSEESQSQRPYTKWVHSYKSLEKGNL